LIENVPFYKNLLQALANKMNEIPPSGAIAGIYCATDNARGVWKAPANVSLSAVSGVSKQFTNAELDALNIDANAGKSINAIRPITGQGIMVMGGRTLAGNSNEWRYVPVRRFFNYVEESCKKSTQWAVFEPNDANLWLGVKTMIENFLYNLWRRGALAGAKPEQAYYVHCGLNRTMTAQDILEGSLIVEIGMATVRPAEFIVLKFSHKLQES
jgi:phage tail sheath protein FI